MHRLTLSAIAGAALTLAMAGAAAAQTPQAQGGPRAPVPPVPALGAAGQQSIGQTAAGYAANTGGEPDVFLDVPNLSVEQITLEVDNVQVHLALDARLGNLLKLTAGADASIDKVKLTIKGVKAQAQLRVHLDNVAAIIDRTLTTVDRNPQLIERALGTVDNAVNNVSGVANTALQPGGVVSQTVDSLGNTVVRTVDSAGRTIERTLGPDGREISSRVVQGGATTPSR